MKKIGIIVGMSWESTRHYYEVMNRLVQSKLWGYNSIDAIIYSVNFEAIMDLVNQNDWVGVEKVIAEKVKTLEDAGVDFILMTSNAIHKIYDQIQSRVPILHIADPTGDAILKTGIKKVGLLGTKVTMEESFYKKRLKDKHGIEVIIPQAEERERLHQIIFQELTLGIIKESSKAGLIRMVENLVSNGAEGVILGCTELTLLISQAETAVLLFDTTDLHATAAVNWALSN